MLDDGKSFGCAGQTVESDGLDDEMKTAFTATRVGCNDLLYVVADSADFGKWEGGMMVQDAFPYLSASDRVIITVFTTYHTLLR